MPWARPTAFFLPASVPQQRPKEPLGRLERLAESSSEFQAVVQGFLWHTGHSPQQDLRVR